MQSIKVDGRLVKNSGGGSRLLPIMIVILVAVVSLFGSREYIRYQLNSENFLNAYATIEQLSEKYGYVDEYNLTLEERIKADKDETEGRMNKIYYLDRQEFSKEDYLKYIDVRDYYVNNIHLPFTLTLLGTVLTMFSLIYSVYKLFIS